MPRFADWIVFIYPAKNGEVNPVGQLFFNGRFREGVSH
jgi:hypothetical protein